MTDLEATRDAAERYWPVIIRYQREIERLAAVNADLLAALKAARRIIVAALTIQVDLPEFDPAGHSVVVTIDAAIARAEAAETNQGKDATAAGTVTDG